MHNYPPRSRQILEDRQAIGRDQSYGLNHLNSRPIGNLLAENARKLLEINKKPEQNIEESDTLILSYKLAS